MGERGEDCEDGGRGDCEGVTVQGEVASELEIGAGRKSVLFHDIFFPYYLCGSTWQTFNVA